MTVKRVSQNSFKNRTIAYIENGGGISTLINSVVYTDSNYNTLTANAASTTFGTFRILGTNLEPGANVMLANTAAGTFSNVTSNTTYVGSNEIRANVSVTAGNYTLYVLNPNGSAAIYYSGVTFQPYPQWTTTSYSSSSVVYVQLLTSSTAVEQPITYALVSGTLPTGTSLSANGLISGTATGITGAGQTFTFTVSATDIYNETTQSSITLTISVTDQYFNQTTLLLNGETNTNTYIQDISTNNFALTVSGAATPNRFSPLWGNGYYGNYFDGASIISGTLPATTNSSAFTIEAWIYMTSYPASPAGGIMGTSYTQSTPYGWFFNVRSAGTLSFNQTWGAYGFASTATVPLNQWNHVAAVQTSSTSVTIYLNGTSVATGTVGQTYSSTAFVIGRDYNAYGAEYFGGYISNLRYVSGTAVYTSNFTPPTTPLTAIANTVLLTCQSSSIIDNSLYASALTVSGNSVKVVPNQPFSTVPSTATITTNNAGYYSGYFGGPGYISTTSSSQFIASGNGFTVEAWVFYTAVSNYSFIVSSTTGANNYNPYWFIGSSNTGTWRLSWCDATAVDTGVSITLNTWNHVAIVMTSSGSGVFYVNGVSKATTSGKTLNGSSTGVVIADGGGTIAGTYPLSGYVSNVRYVSNSSVYTSNFTPSTTPLTAIANTALLTCQNSTYIDNSTNSFTLTPTGSTQPSAYQPFTGGTTSTTITPSVYGCASFDGSTGYINLTGSGIALGTNNFTIEFWAYVNAAVSSAAVFFDMRASSSAVAPLIQMYTSNILYYSVGSSNVITGPALALNTWYHIAVSRVSGSTRMFLNGVQVGSTYTDSNTYVAQTNRPILGSYGDTVANRFNGYMSNVRLINGTGLYTSNFILPTAPPTAVANTALLTLQNKNGANNNTFYDDSVNNSAITRIGTPTQGTFTPFSQTGWSNYFDQATGGFLSTPNNPTQLQLGSNNFTVECWLNISTLPTSSLAVVFSVEGSGLDGVIIGINGTNTPILHPFMYLSTTGGSYTSPANPAIFTTALSLNTWYHIAYVRNGNVFSCFINGVQDATTFTLTGALSYNSGCNATVGARAANSGNYFPGYLSNVRVLNGTALYTSNFTPPTAPLTAIANTALLTCQSNRFVDNSVNNFTLTQPNGGIQVQAFSPFAPGVSYSSANNGGSMYFNGTTDYITTTSTVNIGTNNFTCEAWIYLTSTAVSSPGILSSTTNGGIQLSLYGTNGIGIASSGVSWIFYNSSSIVPLNAWTHVVWTRGGTGTNQTSIFINGTRVANGTASSNFGNYTLSVGTVNGYDFAGYISNLKFTNGTDLYGYGNTTIPIPTAPLTPTANTSLLLLGTNTGIQDATGKNDIITVGSAMTQSNTVKYGTGALYFDGSTGAITTTTKPYFAFGTNNFTVEYWVYPISWSTGPTVIDFRGTPGTVGFSDYYSTSGVPNIYKEGTGTLLTSNTAVSVNTWTHIAYVRNSNTMTIYVNGANTGGVTDTTNWVAPSNNATFGAGKGPSLFFNGYLDDLRVTNGVARYTSNFASPSSPDLTL